MHCETIFCKVGPLWIDLWTSLCTCHQQGSSVVLQLFRPWSVLPSGNSLTKFHHLEKFDSTDGPNGCDRGYQHPPWSSADSLCTVYQPDRLVLFHVSHVTKHDHGCILNAAVTTNDSPVSTIDLSDTDLSGHRPIKWSTFLQRTPPPYINKTLGSISKTTNSTLLPRCRLGYDMDFLKSLNVDHLANVYNTVSILDKLVPLRNVIIRKGPSDLLIDFVCRDQKKRGRRQQRCSTVLRNEVATDLNCDVLNDF